MKVFLDTNIILDLLLERDGYEDSLSIFQMQDEGKLKLAVSVLTMVNVAYVYKKTVGQNSAVANLEYLSSLVEVLPIDGDQLHLSIMSGGQDFEDTLQAVCAARFGCDVLVTRNVRDYKFSKQLANKLALPQICTPASFQID